MVEPAQHSDDSATVSSFASVRAEDRPFDPLDWVLLSVLSLIWGASFLFMAIGLEAFEPGLVTLLRVGFGALTIAFLPASHASVPRQALPRVALLGFTWMAFPLSLFPLAQQWIDSSVAGMLNSGMPLMTVLIAWLVFKTPTGPKRLAGVVVGFGGILLISLPEFSTSGTNAAGVLLVLLAVCSYGFAVNIAGPLQREFGALPVIARALGFATAFCLPLGLTGAAQSSFAWDSLAACAAVGIGGTGLAYSLASLLTGRTGAVRMSVVTYVIPLVAVALGVVLRDEAVSEWALAGTLVALAGAFLTSRVD
jgi:drug/metabolite transporter (DMT)-like permease